MSYGVCGVPYVVMVTVYRFRGSSTWYGIAVSDGSRVR